MTAIEDHGRVSNEAEQELAVRTALEPISEEADPDSQSGRRDLDERYECE
jgi:hypothetical protein